MRAVYEVERDRYGLMYSGPLEIGECVRVTPVEPVETEMGRGAYDGIVIQLMAVLKAIDAVAPEGRQGAPPALNHLAVMAQAMRNYIEAEGEALP